MRTPKPLTFVLSVLPVASMLPSRSPHTCPSFANSNAAIPRRRHSHPDRSHPEPAHD